MGRLPKSIEVCDVGMGGQYSTDRERPEVLWYREGRGYGGWSSASEFSGWPGGPSGTSMELNLSGNNRWWSPLLYSFGWACLSTVVGIALWVPFAAAASSILKGDVAVLIPAIAVYLFHAPTLALPILGAGVPILTLVFCSWEVLCRRHRSWAVVWKRRLFLCVVSGPPALVFAWELAGTDQGASPLTLAVWFATCFFALWGGMTIARILLSSALVRGV